MARLRVLGIGDICLMAAAVAIFVGMFAPRVSSGRYSYDEADYMFAVERGLAANYLDSPTIPFTTFLDQGIHGGMDSTRKAALSRMIRQSGDIPFYRHFHAPLYFYWLEIPSRLLHGDEQATRWATLALLVLTFIAMYVGCLMVFGPNGRVTAIVASLMLLLSRANIATASGLTPHAMYVLTSIVALLSMALFVRSGERKHWYLSVATVTLGLLSIEYAAVLVVTLLATAWMQREVLFERTDPRTGRRLIVQSLLLPIAIILLAWPAGIIKLTLVKDYIFFAYFALIRSGAYGTDSFTTVWWHRIGSSPVEYLLIACGVGSLLYHSYRRELDRRLVPFAVYALLMLATTLRNKSPEPTYVSSLLPPLFVITGYYAERLLGGRLALRNGAIIGTITVALLVIDVRIPSRPQPAPSAPADYLIGYFQQRRTDGLKLLVPNELLPTIHYYFPAIDLSPYPAGDTPSLIARQVETGGFTCVLVSQRIPDSLLTHVRRGDQWEVTEVTPPGHPSPFYYYHAVAVERSARDTTVSAR